MQVNETLSTKQLGRSSQSGDPSPRFEICQRIPGRFFLTPNLDSQDSLPLLSGIVDVGGGLGGTIV